MKLVALGYAVKASLGSRHSFTHFKVHVNNTYRHLVWGKVSVLFGPKHYCQECDVSLYLGDVYCDACHEELFCECGQRLEDAYGQKGDGFCIQCR